MIARLVYAGMRSCGPHRSAAHRTAIPSHVRHVRHVHLLSIHIVWKRSRSQIDVWWKCDGGLERFGTSTTDRQRLRDGRSRAGEYRRDEGVVTATGLMCEIYQRISGALGSVQRLVRAVVLVVRRVSQSAELLQVQEVASQIRRLRYEQSVQYRQASR